MYKATVQQNSYLGTSSGAKDYCRVRSSEHQQHLTAEVMQDPTETKSIQQQLTAAYPAHSLRELEGRTYLE